MSNVQYVTDESGTPVAVQIPIQDWKLIKAELEPYDGDSETAEILDDAELLASVMRGREQVKRRQGKPLSKVSI
jgi:PHD/YefM family antitoxin component YafN of YafNO toxin-antitoxin module